MTLAGGEARLDEEPMPDHDAALTAIRECAMAMLDNAQFIEGELPRVTLTAELKKQVADVCESLVGTKHDLIHEIFEFDELRGSGASEAKLVKCLDGMVGMIAEVVGQLHRVVMALRKASAADTGLTMASVLVMESATNILHAYEAVREARASE